MKTAKIVIPDNNKLKEAFSENFRTLD